MTPPTPTATTENGSPIDVSQNHNETSADDHVLKAKRAIEGVRGPLDDFKDALEGLHSHSVQLALLGNGLGSKQDVLSLQHQMHDQHKQHEDGIAEIQDILDDLLRNNVVDEMRDQVEQQIADQIDELVRAHVAECLRAHIPQDLQDEIANSKHELERLTHSLHNSESRRANADLRSDKPASTLATMRMANDGKVSTRYPKDLQGLFGLDNNTTLALMSDYDIEMSPGSSEIVNLNKFIHFCGVRRPVSAGSAQ